MRRCSSGYPTGTTGNLRVQVIVPISRLPSQKDLKHHPTQLLFFSDSISLQRNRHPHVTLSLT